VFLLNLWIDYYHRRSKGAEGIIDYKIKIHFLTKKTLPNFCISVTNLAAAAYHGHSGLRSAAKRSVPLDRFLSTPV